MDPVTLIVTALAAGAGVGMKDTASAAVQDAYAGLKSLVRKRIAGRPGSQLVLARHEQDSQTWEVPLAAELEAVNADQDSGLVAAAQALMHLVDGAGFRAGKYNVDVRGGQGVQVGDHNIQRNSFGSPPSA
jgi:hypothetical protein